MSERFVDTVKEEREVCTDRQELEFRKYARG